MMDWNGLSERFHKLSKHFGNDKSSSFLFEIQWTLFDGVNAHLGTYDIADWPRHLTVSADSELELFNKVHNVVKNAEKIKELQLMDIEPTIGPFDEN